MDPGWPGGGQSGHGGSVSSLTSDHCWVRGGPWGVRGGPGGGQGGAGGGQKWPFLAFWPFWAICLSKPLFSSFWPFSLRFTGPQTPFWAILAILGQGGVWGGPGGGLIISVCIFDPPKIVIFQTFQISPTVHWYPKSNTHVQNSNTPKWCSETVKKSSDTVSDPVFFC